MTKELDKSSQSVEAEHGEGWRPIESAPKDGTRVLAFWRSVKTGDWLQSVLHWSEGCWCVADSPFLHVIYPTHWRPLPPPPGAAPKPAPIEKGWPDSCPTCGAVHTLRSPRCAKCDPIDRSFYDTQRYQEVMDEQQGLHDRSGSNAPADRDECGRRMADSEQLVVPKPAPIPEQDVREFNLDALPHEYQNGFRDAERIYLSRATAAEEALKAAQAEIVDLRSASIRKSAALVRLARGSRN